MTMFDFCLLAGCTSEPEPTGTEQSSWSFSMTMVDFNSAQVFLLMNAFTEMEAINKFDGEMEFITIMIVLCEVDVVLEKDGDRVRSWSNCMSFLWVTLRLLSTLPSRLHADRNSGLPVKQCGRCGRDQCPHTCFHDPSECQPLELFCDLQF